MDVGVIEEGWSGEVTGVGCSMVLGFGEVFELVDPF